MTTKFITSDWMEHGGRFQVQVTADPEGAHFCAVKHITAAEGETPFTDVLRMDILARADGSRATVATIAAAAPFNGQVEFAQGPPVPEGFVPLEMGGD